jgi:phosphate acetyltransferase
VFLARKWAVGDRISFAPPQLLDVARIAAFGAVSGDSSPTHLSDEAARAAHYPAAIAHGILGLAFCGRTIEKEFPDYRLLTLQARFVAMTFHGDTLSGTGTIEAIDVETAEMRLALVVNNQRSIAVLRGTASLAHQSIAGTKSSPS